MAVRVNNLASEWGRADLDMLAQSAADVLVCYPKADNAEELAEVVRLVRAGRADRGVWPMVETTRGLLAMPEIAAPHLEELVARVRESSSISVLDGHHIVYVARVPTKRIMTVAISVGTRFPAYATSMGRVLLAGMSDADLDRYLAEAEFEPFTARTVTDPDRLREIVGEVGRLGYAIVDQELEEGLRAIAAPIHGAGDTVTAAINVSAHASRVSMAAMRTDLLPALQETARRIEADLKSQGSV